MVDTPADGSYHFADQLDAEAGTYYAAITFCGHGDDPEDGIIEGSSVQWHARENGSGGIFAILGSDPGPGACPVFRLHEVNAGNTTYEIRLSVMDSGGTWGVTSILVTVYSLI